MRSLHVNGGSGIPPEMYLTNESWRQIYRKELSVAHNSFSMAMMLVTTEEYGDQENGEHFFLDIIETWKNTIVPIFL